MKILIENKTRTAAIGTLMLRGGKAGGRLSHDVSDSEGKKRKGNKKKKKKEVDRCIQSKYCHQREFSFSTQRWERNNKKRCFLPFESVRRSAGRRAGFALSLNF